MPPPARTAVLSADELAALLTALFGTSRDGLPRATAAEALRISKRSMDYLLSGDRPVHEGYARDLIALCETRATDLSRHAEDLRRRVAEAGD